LEGMYGAHPLQVSAASFHGRIVYRDARSPIRFSVGWIAGPPKQAKKQEI